MPHCLCDRKPSRLVMCILAINTLVVCGCWPPKCSADDIAPATKEAVLEETVSVGENGIRDEGPPTAAFLDLDGSPLGALLEQRLLDNPHATWLERTAIDAIQKEQHLAGLTDPAAGRQRVALGKLLKADLLVLLRAQEKPEKAMQLVVCETTHGLRLLTREFSVTDQNDAKLGMLETAVDWAIEKQGNTIEEIVAVPPFVSQDLSFRYGYLQGAYATLAERAVADLPGVLLVELDEARAIARELAMVGESGQLRRPLPLYVMGEFRHQRNADPPRVNIKLEIHRGEEILAQRAADIEPDAASTFLRKATGELIQQTVGSQRRLPDPKEEAKHLADRAHEFRQLEQWEEAAGLLEAALLLDGVREYHGRAAGVYATLAPEYAFDRRRPWEERVRGLDYYLCGLDHLETYVHTFDKNTAPDLQYLGHPLGSFSRLSNSLFEDLDVPDEFQKTWEEERLRVRETLIRVLRTMVHSGAGDGACIIQALCKPLPRKEQFDLVYRFLIEFQDEPDVYLRIWGYAPLGISPRILNTPEGEEFLVRLERTDHAAIRAGVAQYRRWLAMFNAPARRDRAVAPEPIAKSQPVKFTPIEFPAITKEGDPVTLRQLWCCIPAGPRMEITADESGIYAIEETGPLKTLWKSDGYLGLFRVTEPAYDGRFVWLPACLMGKENYLLVLDPISGETWKVTDKDGLPLELPEDAPRSADTRFLVAAVAPGRVCVAGQSGRSWIAMIDFDPRRDKPATVEVIHEARIARDRTHRDTWVAPNVAFQPVYMITLTDNPLAGTEAQQRVLVGRWGALACPLLVDPATHEVSPLTPAFPSSHDMPRTFTTHQGAVFFPIHSPRDPSYNLYRLGFPSLTPEQSLTYIPYGRLASDGERLHLINADWKRMRKDGKYFETLGKTPWFILNKTGGVKPDPDTPWLDRVLFSRRFGFLVGVGGGGKKSFMYQVTFDDVADVASNEKLHNRADSAAETDH